jgi:hypothetical protein
MKWPCHSSPAYGRARPRPLPHSGGHFRGDRTLLAQQRGQGVGLPSGEAVARRLHQLAGRNSSVVLHPPRSRGVYRRPSSWPVGGRIVTEVLKCLGRSEGDPRKPSKSGTTYEAWVGPVPTCTIQVSARNRSDFDVLGLFAEYGIARKAS